MYYLVQTSEESEHLRADTPKFETLEEAVEAAVGWECGWIVYRRLCPPYTPRTFLLDGRERIAVVSVSWHARECIRAAGGEVRGFGRESQAHGVPWVVLPVGATLASLGIRELRQTAAPYINGVSAWGAKALDIA